MKNKKILYIVIPVYNEESLIEHTSHILKAKLNKLIKLNKISKKSKILYINDGSKDNSWNIIKEVNKKDKIITAISLSRNYGQQNALLAGLMTAKEKADIVITMDADLQDDINIIDKMIEKYNEGYDIVYGVRSSRKKDSFFKRITAQGFYKSLKLCGADIIYNHGEYRLTSKKIINELENFNEVNLFLRGIFPLIGFNSTIITYERKERYAGKTKYSLNKMISLAIDGITSLSVKPLKLITILGVLIFILGVIGLILSIILKCSPEFKSLKYILSAICLSTGLIIISIGIVGEYIGKIFNEVKRRPRYIISENLMQKIDEK